MMRFALALAALVLVAAHQDKGKRPEQGKGPDAGQDAPDFTLKSTDGKKEVTLSKLKDKPVVLIFGSYT